MIWDGSCARKGAEADLRPILIISIVAIVVALMPAPAQAICDMNLRSLKNVRFTGGDSYDIYNATETAQTAFFDVRHKKSDACAYFVTFSEGQSGTYDRAMSGPGTPDLGYQIYDTSSKSNVLKELPEATATEILSGSFGTGKETQEQSFYVAIPPNQYLAAGTYTDNITVRLYEGTLSSYTLRDTADFDVRARIEKALQLCVVGCGAPFDPFAKSRTLAFGEMHTGDYRELDLLVRGNLDYEVRFRSVNRGVMELTGGNAEVPYSLTLNGTPVDLTSGRVTVANGNEPTGPDGDRYTVTATIGSLASATAGAYEDIIEITVRSQ